MVLRLFAAHLSAGMNPVLPDFPDEFETERLLVRTPRSGDGAAVFEAVVETLAELRTWPASLPWALGEPSVEASEEFCRCGQEAFLARRDLPMLMFLKAGNVYVGGTGLHRIDWNVPKFEIGYWCRRRFQGQGFTSEAIGGLVHFAQTHLGARRLETLPDAENLASRRVAERCGFTLEGILRNERRAPESGLRDTCVYAREK